MNAIVSLKLLICSALILVASSLSVAADVKPSKIETRSGNVVTTDQGVSKPRRPATEKIVDMGEGELI